MRNNFHFDRAKTPKIDDLKQHCILNTMLLKIVDLSAVFALVKMKVISHNWYTQEDSKIGFWQRESQRNPTILNDPILEIWGRLRSSDFAALAPPKIQFLSPLGYISY